MLGLFELLVYWLCSRVNSRRRLEAENLVFRHQVNILRRRAPKRLRLSNLDRLIFVWLCRLCPVVADAVTIIRPGTVIRWHQQGSGPSGAGSPGPEAVAQQSHGRSAT
jgi:hypothetical protein